MSTRKSMKKLALLNVLLLASLASPAWAQNLYKWVDEDGEVHYSQTLPPEQAARAHDRLTRNGQVAERVERVKTGDELASLKVEQELQREEAELRKIQAQRDRLFLAAHPTEEDVRRVIDGRRETVAAERQSVESLLEQNRTSFANDVEQAAALERRGKPVPEALVRRIAADREQIRELNDRLDEIDARLSALDEELAAKLERYRRLTDSG